MNLEFSIVIPIYNRPKELDELLDSLSNQDYQKKFQVIIVEDGSNISAEDTVQKYKDQLNIEYYFKENSGAGSTRNFGMQRAKGNYFIVLDSDCILPEHYLTTVDNVITANFTDAYGGADATHKSFTTIQKAIGYAMTSVLTTGGIRGNKRLKNRFQPRSFNMGMSKEAFQQTKGFRSINFGEDIDMTHRLWENGFKTQFIDKGYVYHKRRVTWKSFFNQTFNFGAARPILNKLHPKTAKITYWFPSVFTIGLLIAVVALFFKSKIFILFFALYLLFVLIDSLIKNINIITAIKSMLATVIMFFGYGLGFLRSTFRLYILKKSTNDTFPEMFG